MSIVYKEGVNWVSAKRTVMRRSWNVKYITWYGEKTHYQTRNKRPPFMICHTGDYDSSGEWSLRRRYYDDSGLFRAIDYTPSIPLVGAVTSKQAFQLADALLIVWKEIEGANFMAAPTLNFKLTGHDAVFGGRTCDKHWINVLEVGD
jgi:hypothetical protein